MVAVKADKKASTPASPTKGVKKAASKKVEKPASKKAAVRKPAAKKAAADKPAAEATAAVATPAASSLAQEPASKKTAAAKGDKPAKVERAQKPPTAKKPAAKKAEKKTPATKEGKVTKPKAEKTTAPAKKAAAKKTAEKAAPSSPSKAPSPKKAPASKKAAVPKKEKAAPAKKGSLQPGDKLPEFSVEADTSTPDNQVLQASEDLTEDTGAVIFFYPKANTGGCTKQAQGFQENASKLEAAGYKVFGMSADKPKSQANWKTKYSLDSITLLSDPSYQILKKLGVTKGEKSIARSHIVVGKGGAVEDVQIGVSPGDSVAKAVAKILKK